MEAFTQRQGPDNWVSDPCLTLGSSQCEYTISRRLGIGIACGERPLQFTCLHDLEECSTNYQTTHNCNFYNENEVVHRKTRIMSELKTEHVHLRMRQKRLAHVLFGVHVFGIQLQGNFKVFHSSGVTFIISVSAIQDQ